MSQNPFSNDPDRSHIWTMLVERDIIAFCHADWNMVKDDFVENGFMGLDGGKLSNPDLWKINFPDLLSYKNEWIRQARIYDGINDKKRLIREFNELTDLSQIDIVESVALAHKKFDGYLTNPAGKAEYLNWQTLYQCRKINSTWKISGFLGYLPYPLGDQAKD